MDSKTYENAGQVSADAKLDNSSPPENEAAVLQHKIARLTETLERAATLIVAYSGGVDSSLLSFYARRVLKEKAIIVIAVSPSLAHSELEAARAQALQFNWNLVEIITDEVERADYQRNDEMRCYFCKNTLFSALATMAQQSNIDHIAYGANIDDLQDFRPGHKAAREFKVLSPLQTAQLSKHDIRVLAKSAGLPSWDRPQAACLSSRFPTFQPVTIESLSQVEKAEEILRSLGFKQVRVRHHDRLACIEVDKSELPRLLNSVELYTDIVENLKNLGYQNVAVDLEGYKQGSANNLNTKVADRIKTNGKTSN